MARKKRGVALEQRPYLTLEQIAEILQITVETVRTYLRRKNNPLPHYRIGREYRVKHEDFDKWMEEQKGKQDD